MQDFERDIMRQIGIEVGERRRKTEPRQRPRDETKPKPGPAKKGLKGITDDQLVTELRNRGYEITARKIVEI